MASSNMSSNRRKFLKILENSYKKKNPGKPVFSRLFGTFCGGDNRDRTGDLLNAIQYKPVDLQWF